jgi:hypothetical protein
MFFSLSSKPNDFSMFFLNQELKNNTNKLFFTTIEFEKYWGIEII